MSERPTVHPAPAWGFKADAEYLAGNELLPVRTLPDGLVEVCAVPLRRPRLALGDVLRPVENGYEVWSRSGHGTVLVWLGSSYLPRTELVEELVGLGAVVEREGENLLALDVAPSVAAGVMGRLAELAEDGLLELDTRQPPVVAPDPADAAALGAGIRALADAHAEELGEGHERVVVQVGRGELALALENLLPTLVERSIPLSTDEHARTMDLWGRAGLPTDLMASYGIRVDTAPPGWPASVLAHLTTTLADATDPVVQWPGLGRLPLDVARTVSDSQSFTIGAPRGTRLLVVGPARVESVGPYLVLTGFSYAEATYEELPLHRRGRVVTTGPLVLAPAAEPDYREGGSASATAKLSERTQRLHDLLAAPGGVRRLTVRRRWHELFLGVLLGIAMLAIGLGTIQEYPPFATTVLLVGGLAAMIVPGVVNRFRRASAGRRFASDGWLASPTGLDVADQQQPSSGAIAILLPEDMPRDQRQTVADAINAVAARPDTVAATVRTVQWYVTRGISARTFDASLPSRVVLTCLRKHHLGVRAYAIVPRRRGSVVDVLAVREGALRAVGFSAPES